MIVSTCQATTNFRDISCIDFEDLNVWTGIISTKKTNVLPFRALTFFMGPVDFPDNVLSPKAKTAGVGRRVF